MGGTQGLQGAGGVSDSQGNPMMDPVWDRDIVGAELGDSGTSVPRKWLEQGVGCSTQRVSLVFPQYSCGSVPHKHLCVEPQGVVTIGKDNPRGPSPCRRGMYVLCPFWDR